MLEGLHQLGHATESHGEGQAGAAVAGGHLHALVAEVPLPVCVAAYFVLAEDVRDEVPWVGGGGDTFSFNANQDGCTLGFKTEGRRGVVLLSLLAGVKWSIKKPKKL